MHKYNLIVMVSTDGKQVLMCKRAKNPYKDLLNFPGGKIEEGETGFEAAYRELFEETGIDKSKTELTHMLDFDYIMDETRVEVYVGRLMEPVCLKEEVNPLVWLDFDHNFFDLEQFAGEGNIGHILMHLSMNWHRLFSDSFPKPLKLDSNFSKNC